MLEENEDDFDYDHGNVDMDSDVTNKKLLALNSMKPIEGAGSDSKVQPHRKACSFSPKALSPLDSPHALSPKVLSPKPDITSKKEPEQILRLLSHRLANPTLPISLPNSLPVSPRLSNDCSISSADSDGEVLVSLLCLLKIHQILVKGLFLFFKHEKTLFMLKVDFLLFFFQEVQKNCRKKFSSTWSMNLGGPKTQVSVKP